MQLKHISTIMAPSTEGISQVSSMCWSANNKRLAVVTTDRVVQLFDENGERRDKFITKPLTKGNQHYMVSAMAFSPDSTKLAVGQTDNIVFVYKLGAEWGDKKSICNKFLLSQSVTTLTWPHQHPNDLVYGCQDGKVRIGQLRSNKSATLYTTGSYVVSSCSSPDGHGILTGHVDGSIYRFFFESGSSGPAHSKFAVHTCVPYALAWGRSISAAGNDARVSFYDKDGALERTFDYSSEPHVKEFSSAVFNPTGEALVVGNFNKFFTFGYNHRIGDWEEAAITEVPGLYSVTALAWKPDGSRVAMGSLCGGADLYDACLKRARYKGTFEFTYVSLSQVIVTHLGTGARSVLKSSFNCEIQKINVFQDRYIVAHTPETLLMGDLDSAQLSEVPWHSSGSEKFFFDNPSVCMVFAAGELSLIEYGRNELLGCCRTEHMSAHLLSVRINERPPRLLDSPTAAGAGFGASRSEDNKKIAYLLDIENIRVQDLVTGINIATINHDAKIDWLEMNSRGDIVLFRDKRRKLHLYDVHAQNRSTLLNFCNYVQWVPGSDVVVAQSRNTLCVWYNIFAPDKITNFTIKGDVEEIIRASGKTEVVVDEGIGSVSYRLDEGLIGFGTAIEDRKYDEAMSILEGLEINPETEAMWHQLSEIALASGELSVAGRCAAALGDVARARFLHKTSKVASKAAATLGGDGKDFWMVRARLAMLHKDVAGAEGVLVDQGKVDEAIEMYQTLHRWDEAIAVAESRGHSAAADMRQQYAQYLLDSGQEAKAGALKEKEGDYRAAINLYLKGGYPAKAMALVNSRPSQFNQDVLEKVASALTAAGMYDKGGQMLEQMGRPERALDAYVRGHAYRNAVELARRHFPSQVVGLEQSWGDYLVSQKQVDAAIAHYIEAGANTAAINAAIESRQYIKAAQLVDDTIRDPDAARPFLLQIARHYQQSGALEEAEKFFIKAGEASMAVDMYMAAGKWESSHAVARQCMSEEDVSSMYIQQAQRLEREGDHRQAERLYITVDEPDLAINMYKKARQFDNMIRLVKAHRKNLIKETHLHLAQQLEMEGNLKMAETYYADAADWESAVNMYRGNDMWEEAHRVAKIHGGPNAGNRVAYAWALHIGGDEGSKLLTKLGLVSEAINYAVETSNFDHAFSLARSSLREKLPEVHLKHALFLEDEGRFKEAEEEFVAARKPKEAIDMYIHQQDWSAAMRVGEQYDPASIPEVLVAQGRLAVEEKDFARAETFFVDAKKPNFALRAYMDARKYPEALRVAKAHLPHQIKEVNAEIQRRVSGESSSKDEFIESARMWERSRNYTLAIQAYLNVTQAHDSDPEQLEKIWMSGVNLAQEHEKQAKYMEVAEDVAHRLLAINKFQKAGDLFRDVQQFKQAIDAYIRAESWDPAREIARTAAPQYRDYVEGEYAKHLKSAGDADGMVKMGAVDTALDIFAQRGEWEKVFEVAGKEGGEKLAHYAFPFMQQMLDDGRATDCVAMFSRYSAPAVASQFAMYQRLVGALLSGDADHVAPDSVLLDAREVMYKVTAGLKRAGPSAHLAEFERLLLILHYASLRSVAREHGLSEMATRLSISLLRFVGPVPADRIFYEAGIACRNQKWLSMAFVLLNRYLDVTEAMDGGDAGMIDNSDFVGTDIPSPYDFTLPSEQFLPEEKRDEVRDWVLAVSMDAKLDQALSTRACEKCRDPIYEAGLICPKCSSQYPPCVVSGYPVPASQRVTCTSCSSIAHKQHWNAFVVKSKACPWCHAPQTPVY